MKNLLLSLPPILIQPDAVMIAWGVSVVGGPTFPRQILSSNVEHDCI
jgi:hypothetical protein